MPLGQEVMTDYSTTRLSLKQHPVALVRRRSPHSRILTAREANDLPHGRWVKVAGLVLIRQRPGRHRASCSSRWKMRQEW